MLIVMTLLSLDLNAKAKLTDSHLVGHVIDASTGEHIPFCQITFKNTSTGCLTDASGHYALHDLTPGCYIVEVAYPGYKTSEKEVIIEEGKTTELKFALQPDAFMLDQVVVTSSKSETKRRESPNLVNVTTGKMLTQVGACSLADGLDFQPGVRVENDCQNCGFTQVRINGLDGHYSQILMNSRPVFSALAGVYGLEQIPANMIDRIEVMRGGGSALFGSSAIGGTINIITKDPVVNTAQVRHTLTSIGLSSGFDNNTTFNASVVADNQRAGLLAYGQSRNRDGYDHNGDGFTEIAKLNSQTIGVRGFLRPNSNSRLTAEYHTTHEYRRGGDNIDQPPHLAMVAEQTEHNIHAGEVTFDRWFRDRRDHLSVYTATQAINRDSYYGSEMDPDAYGQTSDLMLTAGAQIIHPFSKLLFMPSELVGGLEYSFNRLHDVTLGYDHDILQHVHIYSGYLQNEWRNEKLGFLIGARIDKHSLIHDAIVSPRVNIRYNPSDRFNFRASYTTGFRSPQAYDEDFHVAIVGGERVVTVLDPNLKQESSQSLSLSADMYLTLGQVQTNFLIEGFYTDLRDVFALRQLDQTDAFGNLILERYNGSGATVMGLNFEAKLFFSQRLDLQMGLTLQRSRFKKPEVWSDDPDVAPVRRMFRTPDCYGYVTGNWNIARHWTMRLNGTYTGSMLVQHLQGAGTTVDVAKKTPTFFDADLRLLYTFKLVKSVDVEVNAGVNNLFDSYQRDFDCGYRRDSGYIYGPAQPRSLSVGASISL